MTLVLPPPRVFPWGMAPGVNGVSAILGPDGQPFARPNPRGRPPLANANGPLHGEDGWLLPHQRSFSAIYNAISRTYRFTADEALRQDPKAALAMRRDVTLLEMLRERMLPVAQLRWSLEPEDPKDPFQAAVALDLEQHVLKRTPRFTQIRLNLLEAAWWGRAGVQVRWAWQPATTRQLMRIVDHRPVNGDKIQYDYDGVPGVFVNGAAAGDYDQGSVTYTDRAPLLKLDKRHWREKFFIHRHEIEDSDYWEPELAGAVQGVGIRGRIFWAWWMRNEVITWMLDYMERVGAGGLTVFYYDASDPAAKTIAENAAINFDRNTAFAWPRYSGGKETGSGIERIEPGSGGSDIILQIVQYWDEAIRRYVVGQTLSSRAEGTGLGSGVSEFHADTKDRILQFDAENLDETLTTDYVAVAKHWNYHGTADHFAVRFRSSLDKPEPEKKLEAVGKAYEMGVTFKADEVRELTGLSKPELGDDDTLEKGPDPVPGLPGFGAPGESPPEGEDDGERDKPLARQFEPSRNRRPDGPRRYGRARLDRLERSVELLVDLLEKPKPAG